MVEAALSADINADINNEAEKMHRLDVNDTKYAI